jgi:hypothetical protein
MSYRYLTYVFLAGSLLTFAPMSARADWTSPASNYTSNGSCSVTVQQQQDALRKSAIADRVALATLVYPQMTSPFSQLSCLDNLLSGMSIVFSPPSLGSLLNALMNAVCQEATSMVSQAIAPLNSALSGGLPMGSLFGTSLGSLNTGFAISPNIGGGSNLIVGGGNSVLGPAGNGRVINLNGQWNSGAPSFSEHYGGLFGNTQGQNQNSGYTYGGTGVLY